jgi:hypothetical protein
MSTVFSFENPRRFTTDANQKLRRFCPPFSQLRTLCIGKHTFPTPLFVTSPRLMHASYYIPGSAKFGTIFRGVKPIPTSTTYTTPLFGLSSTKEGNQKKDAHESLRGTESGRKHDILFSQFGINYSALPLRYRKGSVLVREQLSNGEIDASEISIQDVPRTNSYGSLTSNHITIGSENGATVTSPRPHGNHRTRQESTRIALLHCDIIGEDFWNHRPYLLWDD